LRELPNFTARPGTRGDHHTGQINTPLTKDEWNSGLRAARAGELPDRVWTEIYLHTVYDPSVAPAGVHTMSVFSQYVPHRFAHGTWDTRRDETGQRVIADIGGTAATFPARSPAWSAGAPGCRAARGTHGWPHLPGRHPARVHVGSPPGGAHADARTLSVRGRDVSRRERHRHPRPKRRARSARRGWDVRVAGLSR